MPKGKKYLYHDLRNRIFHKLESETEVEISTFLLEIEGRKSFYDIETEIKYLNPREAFITFRDVKGKKFINMPPIKIKTLDIK